MCNAQQRAVVVFVLAVALIVGGLTLYFIFPTLQRQKIRQLMVLSEKNAVIRVWRDVPAPISFDIYLFNVTNADNVTRYGEKPRLQQVGPYTFREKRQKVNITWNSNSTVSYRQIIKWYYVDGKLNDNITTINVPLLMAASLLKAATGFVGMTARILLKKSRLFITHTAGELLFQGYEDDLLKLANKLHVLPVNTSKFGWFLLKNNSDNGLFNVFTGEQRMEDFAVIDKWNGLSNTTFYDSPCNKIEGTAGELWPPFTESDDISIFVAEACRTVKMKFEGETMMKGINVRTYMANERIFDKGTYEEENKCFCKDQCLPHGAIDVAICNHKSPVVISMPHFSMADPSFLENVEGLKPDPDRYRSFVNINPEMGMPVLGSKKFQMNVLIKPDKKLVHFAKMNKTIVLPVLWFNESMTMSPKLVEKLQQTTQNLPYYCKIASIVLVTSGIVLFFGLLLGIRNKKQNGGWCAFTKKTIQYPAVHFGKISNGDNQQSKQHNDHDIPLNKC